MNMNNVDRRTPPPIRDFPALMLPPLSVTASASGNIIRYFEGGDQPVNKLTFSFRGGKADVVKPAALIMLGSLMREGIEGMSGGRISEKLDYNGAWLKTDVDNHHVDVHLHSLNATTLALLPMVTDIIFHPTLPEHEFTRLRSQMAATSEMRAKRVESIANRKLARMVMGHDHPIANVYPSASDFMSLTIDDVRLAHKSVILGGKAEIAISGMVDQLIHDVEGLNLPCGDDDRAIALTPFVYPSHGSVVSIEANAKQSAVQSAIPAIARTHPDYIELRLAVMALGGYFGSRLMTKIREELGLTYGITAVLLGYNEGSIIKIAASTDKANVSRLIAETADVIRSLTTDPVDVDSLAEMKAFAMSNLAATLDSPFSIMDYHTTIRRISAPDDYFTLQQEAIHRISPQRIAELIAKYVDPEMATTVVAG